MDPHPMYRHAEANPLRRAIRRSAGWKPISWLYARTLHLLGSAPALRVIGRAGVGVDNVDVDAATTAGIVVCNAPEANVVSAAEHALALLLALARNISGAERSLRDGAWERERFAGVLEGASISDEEGDDVVRTRERPRNGHGTSQSTTGRFERRSTRGRHIVGASLLSCMAYPQAEVHLIQRLIGNERELVDRVVDLDAPRSAAFRHPVDVRFRQLFTSERFDAVLVELCHTFIERTTRLIE